MIFMVTTIPSINSIFFSAVLLLSFSVMNYTAMKLLRQIPLEGWTTQKHVILIS